MHGLQHSLVLHLSFSHIQINTHTLTLLCSISISNRACFAPKFHVYLPPLAGGVSSQSDENEETSSVFVYLCTGRGFILIFRSFAVLLCKNNIRVNLVTIQGTWINQHGERKNKTYVPVISKHI